MSAKLNRFFQIYHSERSLFLKAGFIGTYFSIIISLLPFKWYSRWLGVKGAVATTKTNTELILMVKKIEKAMLRVKRYFPWRIKCLARALTAKYLLKNRNIPSTIYLGVAKENPDKIIAHAWLQCMDITVTGKEEKSKFAPLVFFT